MSHALMPVCRGLNPKILDRLEAQQEKKGFLLGVPLLCNATMLLG